MSTRRVFAGLERRFLYKRGVSPSLRKVLSRSVALICALAVPACIWWDHIPWESDAARHEPLIIEAANRAGVDAQLLRAIVEHESGYDARKVTDGAYGLMQLGRGTGMEWAAIHKIETFMVTDLLDARTNLHAGAWYLGRCFPSWWDCDNPTVFALAEYVAGRDAVIQWAAGSKRADQLREAMRGTEAGAFVEAVLKLR
jgi:soluble lytic murein transglycosylase-like protein